MLQLIDADGTFKYDELQRFVNTFPRSTGASYFIISIIGPQSGGKSTLLNALFRTNFRVMNGFVQRNTTTQGVWMARGEGIGPWTIVMDIEGTDGSHREDDTTFEKQSALFAFAISDVVMININSNDIGRANGASGPLLRIIFQARLNLVGEHIRRKTTLMFVIRDRVNPHDVLEGDLQIAIRKIWKSVKKTQAHQCTPFEAFFNVEVVSLVQYTELSNGGHRIENEMEETYRKLNNKFTTEVDGLKQRLQQLLAPGGVARVRPEKDLIPISLFPSRTKKIWLIITKIGFANMASHLEEIKRQTKQEERIREAEERKREVEERMREMEERNREAEKRIREAEVNNLILQLENLARKLKKDRKSAKRWVAANIGVTFVTGIGSGVGFAIGMLVPPMLVLPILCTQVGGFIASATGAAEAAKYLSSGQATAAAEGLRALGPEAAEAAPIIEKVIRNGKRSDAVITSLAKYLTREGTLMGVSEGKLLALLEKASSSH